MNSIPLRQWEAAAYAAGTLTQLRRVVKPQPVDAPSFVHYGTKSIVKEVASGQIFTTEQCIAAMVQFCPYGRPGDALALRETWQAIHCSVDPETGYTDDWWHSKVVPKSPYLSDDVDRLYAPYWVVAYAVDQPYESKEERGFPWRSPVTMPSWAVRWHPVIQSVRLERVQDVTTADIGRMGIDNGCSNPKMGARHIAMQDMEYMRVWNRDNPRTPWDSNPWVFVIDITSSNG